MTINDFIMLNQIRVKQVTIEGTTISAKSCCLLMKERIPSPNFLWVEEILVSANEKLFFVAESFKLSTTQSNFIVMW